MNLHSQISRKRSHNFLNTSIPGRRSRIYPVEIGIPICYKGIDLCLSYCVYRVMGVLQWEFGEYLRSKTFSRLRHKQALTLFVRVLFLKPPFDPQLERQKLKIPRIERFKNLRQQVGHKKALWRQMRVISIFFLKAAKNVPKYIVFEHSQTQYFFRQANHNRGGVRISILE